MRLTLDGLAGMLLASGFQLSGSILVRITCRSYRTAGLLNTLVDDMLQSPPLFAVRLPPPSPPLVGQSRFYMPRLRNFACNRYCFVKVLPDIYRDILGCRLSFLQCLCHSKRPGTCSGECEVNFSPNVTSEMFTHPGALEPAGAPEKV